MPTPPQPPLIAAVESRDGSSFRCKRFIDATIFAPRADPCSASSLPSDQITTLGWLRSRLISRSNSLIPSGFDDIIRVSSITSMPIRSHASRNSGVGGLCDVLHPFEPIHFSRSRRYA